MDKQKFSLIANRFLKINNPISEFKISKIISLLNLDENTNVIDFGGGKGEILLKIIEKYNVKGTIVEINQDLLNILHSSAENYINNEKLIMVNQDVKEFISKIPENSIDCAVCIGSSGAFGGYMPTISILKKYIRKGGFLILGEGYWKKEPEQEYLNLTGMNINDFKYHYENIKYAEEDGFIYLFSNVASEDDWDEFEGMFSMGVEKYFLENPDDNDGKIMLEKIRKWRNSYLKFGRYTLGFGLYLFEKS